jgi:hypothetical protein
MCISFNSCLGSRNGRAGGEERGRHLPKPLSTRMLRGNRRGKIGTQTVRPSHLLSSCNILSCSLNARSPARFFHYVGGETTEPFLSRPASGVPPALLATNSPLVLSSRAKVIISQGTNPYFDICGDLAARGNRTRDRPSSPRSCGSKGPGFPRREELDSFW